jgi:hypothetical protein
LQKEKTIGFISRFNMINQFDRRPLVATLGFDGNLERAEIQCKQFSVFWKIIDHLVQNTNYKISYRAYPLEAPDEIEKIKKLLKEAGLKNIKIKTFFILAPFLSFLSEGFAGKILSIEKKLFPLFGSLIIVKAS